MNKAHGCVEISRIAAEGFIEFMAVGAQAILIAEEAVKLVRRILRPERIESLLINALGFLSLFHRHEN